jgi:uncharacterized protein (TIGR02246 family)
MTSTGRPTDRRDGLPAGVDQGQEPSDVTKMKAPWTLAALGWLLAGNCAWVSAQDAPRPAVPATRTDRSADEKAIREAGAAFVRAYNANDPAAIAALFAEDAEVIAEDGLEIVGREAIAALFASSFEAAPGETIEVDIDSLRFVTDDVAKEEGRARTFPPKAGAKDAPAAPATPAGTVQSTRYTVLYVKHDGHWLQSAVREYPDTAVTPHERLEPLAWMVGEWVDEGSDSVVFTSTRWSEDGNFLLRDFAIQIEGRPAMKGTQRIGWDPLTKRIMSWAFDSEGGHGTAIWVRDGDRWIVKGSGVRSDGRTATATQVYTVVNPHLVRWKSVDRTTGDQAEPDVAELVMVRKPPRPR